MQSFRQVGLWLAVALVSVVISNAAVLIALIRIPADYFREPIRRRPRHDGRHVVLRGALLVIKNLLGLVLALAGVVLSLPGIPGPGLLLILIGIVLVDLPGKHRLLRRAFARPGTLRAINRLRRRFGKPPLEPPAGRVDREAEAASRGP